MARNAAHAARDTLHDNGSGKEPGVYTTYDARDRAAHTPSILDRELPRNREEEAAMIAALYKEVFPIEERSDEDCRKPPESVFDGTKAMGESEVRTETTADKSPKETEKHMTPEQQASVDKALGQANINDNIGGATEANAKPQPNDPTSMDKAREIGQDLQKQGLVGDRE